MNELAVRRRRLKAILVPVEHGAWSLTLEPIIAGLIVAFSLSGLAIAMAVFVAFLMRQPLRFVIRPVGDVAKTRIALTVAMTGGIVIVALGVLATLGGALSALMFLLAFSPLAMFLLWRDRQRRSRDLAAELSAALFMAASAAAVVVAGGGGWPVAFVLAALMAFRSWGAIFHVRERVSVMKGRRRGTRGLAVGSHCLGLAVAIACTVIGPATVLAPLAFLVLLARTLFPVSATTAARLGWSEIASGLPALLMISFSLG